MTHFTIQPLHWHPLYPNRPKTLTAFHQPHIPAITVPRFYDFINSQKKRKLPINSPIETYHQPITNLSLTYHQPITCHQPFSPNALHFNDAFHNPTFTPPLAPSSPQPPQNPHGFSPTTHPSLYSYTFLRFCKFTEKSKLPINSPSILQAYYKPIH